MKRRKILARVVLGLAMSVGVLTSHGVCAYAEPTEIGDTVGNGEDSGDSSGEISDFLKGNKPLKDGQLNEASESLSPVTNIIGNVIGGVIVLVSSGIFLITVLDLAYIAIPPFRGLLYGQGADGKPKQWISDEALACSALNGGTTPSQSSGMNGMNGMNGMSGMSGTSMGGFGGMQQQSPAQPQGTKSVIFTYLKKRVFFLILFGLCAVVLTSSILIGTGVNVAEWFMKMVGVLNESIPK